MNLKASRHDSGRLVPHPNQRVMLTDLEIKQHGLPAGDAVTKEEAPPPVQMMIPTGAVVVVCEVSKTIPQVATVRFQVQDADGQPGVIQVKIPVAILAECSYPRLVPRQATARVQAVP